MPRGRPKKVKEEIQEKSPVNFSFKITNLRTSAYPNKLTETDLHGFRIGDLINRGNNSLIYKIVDLERTELTDNLDARLRASNRNRPKLNEASRLAEEYTKNGKFGVCVIKAKCIFRIRKIIDKSRRISIFNELEEVIKWNPITKCNLIKELDSVQRSVVKLRTSLNKTQIKTTNQETKYNNLKALLDIENEEFIKNSKIINDIDEKPIKAGKSKKQSICL